MDRCNEGPEAKSLRSDREADLRHILALQPGKRSKHQVRLLHRNDIQAIVRHMLSMNGDDRQSRFFRRMTDGAIVNYYQKLCWQSVVLVGLFAEGELCGIGEAIVFNSDRGMLNAEIAISVGAAWRRQGYGRQLAEWASAEAVLRGATRLHFHYLPHSPAVARIARSLGGDVDPVMHTITISPQAARPQ